MFYVVYTNFYSLTFKVYQETLNRFREKSITATNLNLHASLCPLR